ncbi:MAG: acyltransferase [Rhizobiaceae bacterium]
MSQQLDSIVYYRAISILMIAAGHCLNIAHLFPRTYGEQLFSNFIVGATSLFVFVSGYLFHHVFYPRYRFTHFIKGRLLRVAVPYLVLAIPSVFVIHQLNPLVGDELLKFLTILATGDLYWIYWYIPFICLTFALSPLHVGFISMSTRIQIVVIVALAVVSMLGHRPVNNIPPWHSVIYFAPVYLIGIFVSQHRENLLRLMRGREIYLALAALAMIVLQTELGQIKNSHKPMLEYQGIDWMFLNKSLMALALFFLLERFAGPASRMTRLMADASFAIFFLHPIGIYLIIKTKSFPVLGNPWLDLLLATAIIVGVSLLIAIALKKMMGQRSRFVLGY